MPGKRKREVAVVPRQSSHRNAQKPLTERASAVDHDAFRKHFESVFEPLPESEDAAPSLDESEAEEEVEFEDEESDWEGLSESEPELEPEQEGVLVEVIQHQAAIKESDDVDLQRQQYKSFMVSDI